jgi:RNA polymerase sigma-70 factor (ECF subfamily)
MGAHNGVGVPGASSGVIGDEHVIGGRLGDIITQARNGSTVALGQLLEHCRRYLLLVANDSLDSDLRPKGAASDLVQDTFVAAQRDFPRFQGATEQELLAWLTKILAHRVSKQVRRYRYTQKREVNREVPLGVAYVNGNFDFCGDVPPVDAAIARDDAARMRAALERLPSHLRTVLILRTWERRSFAEIAPQLQGTPESVRKAWARAVRRLQLELQKQP